MTQIVLSNLQAGQNNGEPVETAPQPSPEYEQSTQFEETTELDLQPSTPPENTDHNPVYYNNTFCRDCNKLFSSPDALRKHNLNKHVGLYTCGVCLRGFKTSSCLKNHTATHSRKQVMCCYCDKSFSRASSMREHIRRIHKKEERCLNCGRVKEQDHVCYKCKECSASFRTRVSFANHRCVSTKVYVCPYCEESFTRNQGLQNHMLNQENKRKFKCPVCNDRFNTKGK